MTRPERSTAALLPVAPTLFECFAALEDREDSGHTFISPSGAQVRSFAETLRQAASLQSALGQWGIQRGERVVCAMSDDAAFIVTFLAAIRGGIVPVPAPPPSELSTFALDKTLRIAAACGASAIVCMQRSKHLFTSGLATISGLAHLPQIVAYEELSSAGLPRVAPAALSGSDICFLQFTSGSTGFPKGVQIRHENLAANARFILQDALRLNASDIVVSWLPLHHDMGLIGKLLAPLFFGCPTVFIPTQRFIRSPRVWMETVSQHRGTITFGPNFALDLVTRATSSAAIEALDLTALRVLGCGAEPIHAEVLRRVSALLTRAGMPPQAVLPCYGMAEATLAISFGELEEPPRTVRIKRRAYEQQGRIERLAPDDADPFMELVGCGYPNEEHEIAIVDEHGARRAEVTLGEIVVRGPSMPGAYFGDSTIDSKTYRDGWLHTGDLGFLLDGELYVSGRQKDLIILHGQNIFPQDIEWIAGSAPGARPGGVVAISIAREATEALALVIEARPNADLEVLRQQVSRLLAARAGVVAEQIVFVEPNTLPRTTSGKLQRSQTRSLLMENRLAVVVRTSPTTGS
jgi:fatty-acyl-CoA synthase